MVDTWTKVNYRGPYLIYLWPENYSKIPLHFFPVFEKIEELHNEWRGVFHLENDELLDVRMKLYDGTQSNGEGIFVFKKAEEDELAKLRKDFAKKPIFLVNNSPPIDVDFLPQNIFYLSTDKLLRTSTFTKMAYYFFNYVYARDPNIL